MHSSHYRQAHCSREVSQTLDYSRKCCCLSIGDITNIKLGFGLVVHGTSSCRVLQAHYNGDELVIHKTKLFDFTKKKVNEAMLLVTRWAASSAVGDTVLGNSIPIAK